MIIKLNDYPYYIAIKNWYALSLHISVLTLYDMVNSEINSLTLKINSDNMPELTKKKLSYYIKPFAIPNRYYRLITDRELEYVNAFLLIDNDMPLGLNDANTKLRFEVLRRKIFGVE